MKIGKKGSQSWNPCPVKILLNNCLNIIIGTYLIKSPNCFVSPMSISVEDAPEMGMIQSPVNE